MKKRDLEFLKSHDLSRMATVSAEGRPHVVPVVYAIDGPDVIVAVDYGTKKLKNLRENNHVALVVDDYDPNHAVMIEGDCEILERGREYRRLLQVLYDRFEFYRNNPWNEGESPILKIHPTKIVGW